MLVVIGVIANSLANDSSHPKPQETSVTPTPTAPPTSYQPLLAVPAGLLSTLDRPLPERVRVMAGVSSRWVTTRSSPQSRTARASL